jgi:hypothetical protein
LQCKCQQQQQPHSNTPGLESCSWCDSRRLALTPARARQDVVMCWLECEGQPAAETAVWLTRGKQARHQDAGGHLQGATCTDHACSSSNVTVKGLCVGIAVQPLRLYRPQRAAFGRAFGAVGRTPGRSSRGLPCAKNPLQVCTCTQRKNRARSVRSALAQGSGLWRSARGEEKPWFACLFVQIHFQSLSKVFERHIQCQR